MLSSAAWLFLVSPRSTQNAGEDRVLALAKSRIAEYGVALGISKEELTGSVANWHGTFLTVRTPNWTYTADVSGNQVFRPASSLPYLRNGAPKGQSLATYAVKTSHQWMANLVQTTRDLGGRLGWDLKPLTRLILKKEIVVGGPCAGAPSARTGRYLVRFSDGGSRYAQAVTDTSGQIIRLDWNIGDGKPPIGPLLEDQLASEKKLPPLDGLPGLSWATFYDPSEYRFEYGARAIEGEGFLDVQVRNNPFRHSDFSGSPVELRVNGVFDASARTDLVDFAAWRATDDYRYWRFYDWNLLGKASGVCGNWDAVSQTWQRDVNVESRNLGRYSLVGGEPTEIRNYKLSDGKEHPYPFAISRRLGSAFDTDLARSTCAVFLTHGGPIEDRLQLRRGLDVWFTPSSPDHTLGQGNLRHVFFAGCGAIGAVKARAEGATYLSLFREWLNAKYVSGLRTVCGCDGGMDSSGPTMLRFFAKYNERDSISDAWMGGMIDESAAPNMPATVAYGASTDEALATLADGRFSRERVAPVYAVASLWVDAAA